MLSLAAEQTDKEISSFTVGFSEHFADERPYARLAAESFGTEHHEMTITAEDFAEFLPRYVWHMEEPVCEPPAVALYYVSKLARKHVKVLLSGEGGDEAFAGYSNYRNLVWLERLKRGGSLLKSRIGWRNVGWGLVAGLVSPAKVCAADGRSISRILLQPHL